MIQPSGVVWIECGRGDLPHWSCFNDSPGSFFSNEKLRFTVLLSLKRLRLFIAISGLQHQLERLQVFKVPTLNKDIKKKKITKKWKGFWASLNKFELDHVSYLIIIDKLVLKLLMSLRVPQKYGLLQTY